VIEKSITNEVSHQRDEPVNGITMNETWVMRGGVMIREAFIIIG
jgi:hypothetical protein